MKRFGKLAAGLAGATAVSALAIAIAFASPTPAVNGASKMVGVRVDNFMLPDQTGMGHELYYHRQQPAVVILTAALKDPTSDKAIAALSKIAKAYAATGVEFLVLDSSLKDSRDAVISGMAKVDLPVLADELQLVGRSLGVTTTGEAFLVDSKTWTIAYHGPIDDTFAARKGSGASLTAALDALLAARPMAVSEAGVKGARIDFPDRAHTRDFAKISYAADVAPILAAKCVACHTKGGMAPFSMDRYETVKGFAPMIREVLRTKRMPPFHADAHWGDWSNNMLLTSEQIKTVVNWVEAGSPRGAGEDPLPAAAKPAPEWPLGQPDVVVEIPAFDVPASGVVDYQDRSVATNFADGQGRWLKATAWSGASPAVHHALAGWIPDVRPDGKGFSWNTSLGGYGPGGEANLTPSETGIYIPPGGSFSWQMHYTTTGKPIHDVTKVGYYFYKEPPKYILRQASVTDFSLEIPAGASRWRETAYLEFPHDALLFGTQPHCHSRCYSTKLTIEYPDGSRKVILNQPRYDFAWQREYLFKERFLVPKGAKLIADYVYDNSAANPSNPDPARTVPFGEQTSDEMLFTFIRYTWVGETSSERHDEWQRELQSNITFGALDDDHDGKLAPAEFRNDPRFKPLLKYLPMVDANKDGALDKEEMGKAMQIMAKMRAAGAVPAAPKDDAGTAAMKQGATGGQP